MYEKLANCYDAFMKDVPYEQWIDYVARILDDRKNGLDVGCGTGKFTVGLIKRGFSTVGSDVSVEMLEKANQYALSEGIKATFVNQSATSLTLARPVDFITACCDVVNYIKNPKTFFARAYKFLKEGGVLTFDISSEYKLRTVLANNVFTDSNEDVTYVWENVLNKNSVDICLTFFTKQPNNYYARSVETQTQFIHTTDDIITALEDVGFTDVKTYGFLSDVAPSAREERVQFVAYKKEKNG